MQDVRIAGTAFLSRSLFLAIAFLSDSLLADYDSSAVLNSRDCTQADSARVPGGFVKFADVWDTVFYERISRCGYEYEHYFAFLPGLPRAMAWLGGGADRRVLAAILISLISFTISSVLLYR
jgi:GPI mannosyltransferase 2